MKKKRSWKQLKKDIYRARAIYLMILPVIVWFLLFQYWPMTWLSISFFDYNLYLGFTGSKFVGFQNFAKFFTGMDFLETDAKRIVAELLRIAGRLPGTDYFRPVSE